MAIMPESPVFISRTLFSPYTPLSLEANPTYQSLKSELDSYLLSPIPLSTIHKNLQTLLTEVAYTSNPRLQNELLTKVKAWYEAKTSKNIPVAVSQTPKPVISLEKIPQGIIKDKKKLALYLPKEYKNTKNKLKETLTKEVSIASIANSVTRASSSEPKTRMNRRISQSPGLIRSIVNNFVKNKRGIMYNFTLNEFLEDVKSGTDQRTEIKRRPRPLSSSMKKQFQEVEQVKIKLANKGVVCGVKSLFNALVIDDSWKSEDASLPNGGEQLLKFKK